MPFITTAAITAATAAVTVGASTAAVGTATATAGVAAGISMGTAIALDAALLVAASTGIAATSAYQTGKQQEANAERNAQIMRNQALEEERAALYGATQLAREGRRLRGRQRVLLSKAGVLGAGTPLLLMKQTAEELQADIGMIMRGGRVRGSFLRQKAGITLAGGRDLARAGMIGAGTALLSGASGTLLRYRQMRT